MMLAFRSPSDFAPTGFFRDTLVGTEGSVSASYDLGQGVYQDVTQNSASRTWEYIPGRITDEDTVTLLQNVSGSHQTALVTNGRAAKEFRLSLVVSGGATHPHLIDFVADTYADFSWGIVKAKLDALGKTKRLVASGAYSPTCWAAAYDWSGVARWNSHVNAATMRGVAITRRHLWIAKHWSYPAGTTVRFLTPAGATVERTVAGVAYLGDISDTTQDIYIATLSADLPAEIASYPVAGPWLAPTADVNGVNALQMAGAFMYLDQNDDVQFAPTHENGTRTVQVAADKFTTVRVYDYCEPENVAQYAPLFDGYQSWMKFPVAGDSGSPVMIPLSSSTMSVGTVLTGTYGGEGPDEDDLNVLIAAADANAGVSTGYTVTVAPDPTA